ncbi:MAG: metallophosphoesterase [Eubacteriales bacterium]
MKKQGCLPRLILLLVVGLTLAGFWYFENYTIVTEELSVATSVLPQGFEGYRITQVSDNHGKIFGADNQDLIDAVSATQPDIIVLTGDIVDDDDQLADLPTLVDGMVEIAPTYYISGNHEWTMDMDGVFQIMEDCGAISLRNQYVPLTQNGQTILLAGFDDPNGPADQETPAQVMARLRQDHGDCFVVALYHRNDQLELFADLGVDLVLSGHGHGGIVRLPYIGGVIGTDRSLFPDYTAGLYQSGGTQMVVSRGLGGNDGWDFRIGNRPHLPVVELQR